VRDGGVRGVGRGLVGGLVDDGEEGLDDCGVELRAGTLAQLLTREVARDGGTVASVEACRSRPSQLRSSSRSVAESVRSS
jgi:hypothetical protein